MHTKRTRTARVTMRRCIELYLLLFFGFCFVLFLFQSISFFDRSTHTLAHVYVNRKSGLRPILLRKNRPKTISCSHTENCCLFALRALSHVQWIERSKKIHAHAHTHWVHVNINKVFNTIAVQSAVGSVRQNRHFSVSACSPRFWFFLSVFRAFNYSVCLCHLSCFPCWSPLPPLSISVSLTFGAVLLTVNSKWQQQQTPTNANVVHNNQIAHGHKLLNFRLYLIFKASISFD